MISHGCDGIHQIYDMSRSSLLAVAISSLGIPWIISYCNSLGVSRPSFFQSGLIAYDSHPSTLPDCKGATILPLLSSGPTNPLILMNPDPQQHLLLLISSAEDNWAFQVLVVKNLPPRQET